MKTAREKILCIQFRKNPQIIEQERACIVREAGIYTDIEFLDIFDEGVDYTEPAHILSGYGGLILGGSGELNFDGNRAADDEARLLTAVILEKLRPLFQHLFDNDIPTLGICYGHQLLGAFCGAQVHYDAVQKKSRSHEVKLVVDKNDYFIFSDLPDSFVAHYGHQDVLDRVPDGAVLLMDGGDECKVTALRYKQNIYTTQFHPELVFEDMVLRVQNSPGYLPEGVVLEEIFKDSRDANRILQNFSKMVALHEQEREQLRHGQWSEFPPSL